MNILREVIHKLIETEPKVFWVAFHLNGGGDNFHGFEAIEANIDGKRVKKMLGDERVHSGRPFVDEPEALQKVLSTTFQKIDAIVNKSETQDEMINSILPRGVYFKSVDHGACDGVLLIKCTPTEKAETIHIKTNELSYNFSIKKNFKGAFLGFENSEEDLGKVYPNTSLPKVSPHMQGELFGSQKLTPFNKLGSAKPKLSVYLEKIKKAAPAFKWGAVGFKWTNEGLESFKLNSDTLELDTALGSRKDNEKTIKETMYGFKNGIIKDLLNEEELKIPKDQEYCIRGVICFVGSPFKNGRTRVEFSGLVFYFDIDESFLGIAVKYRLDEKYKRNISLSECK
jgi:hypothetical protein